MNLIAYSLDVYSVVQTEFLVPYVSVWQSMLYRSVVALVQMTSSEFICLFWLRYESYACGDLLNLLYSLHAYPSSWLLACYPVMVSLCQFTLILRVLA
jgi:hypothetical protein